ncbi:MAG: FKBP-type peptidyl-prolyl cis-trans isomerase [Bacteroidetes bacterium]|nr:FKBP-type peptidyl-prolyl cis-trans isomerase [Bacteroidota bacterium]
MMLRSIKAKAITLLSLFVVLLFVNGCKRNKEKYYSYNDLGYYYQLIAFNSTTATYQPNSVAWVDANFKTQSDSVFWDSRNNFNDNFFVALDSLSTTNFLKNYISKLTVADSACLMIRTKDFFKQQFGSDKIPFFSAKDTVVKIDVKIRCIMSADEYNNRAVNLLAQETEQIEAYYKSPQDFEMARDTFGFYWIDKPPPSDLPVTVYKNTVKLSYTGTFLNGRIFEQSPVNFEVSYGTPDQLIKGLNYVIKRLKKGQNAKIILPSRLAFGENGSTNGIIAPYTPLIYEIKIIDVKTNDGA